MVNEADKGEAVTLQRLIKPLRERPCVIVVLTTNVKSLDELPWDRRFMERIVKHQYTELDDSTVHNVVTKTSPKSVKRMD